MDKFQVRRNFAQVRSVRTLVVFIRLPMDHVLADLGTPNLISLLQAQRLGRLVISQFLLCSLCHA